MRAFELTERISTSWVKSWVETSAPAIPPAGITVDWVGTLFKNLNKGKTFKDWAKQNVKGPITIKPRIVDDETSPYAILDAEHLVYEDPLKHEIISTINIGADLSDKKFQQFLDKLGSRLIHELNHAHQVSQQMGKNEVGAALDLSNSPFSKQPPDPKNANEEHFQYLLDNLERDAWVSEVANDIRNAVGDRALKVLNGVLQQVKTQEYAVIGPKIIQLPTLHHLYLATKYYGGYLKQGSAGTWQQVKKELYGYLSR
jgi:hypothetical protein